MSIGGYLGLELGRKQNSILDNKMCFNSGRSACLHYLNQKGIDSLWVPYYICGDFVTYLLSNLISINYYNIDTEFKIVSKIPTEDNLLYVNYLGIMDSYIETLSEQYTNLIVDNSQALFSVTPQGTPAFYSPRKFLGIPDGGILSSELSDTLISKAKTHDKCNHLLKQLDLNVEEGYVDFLKNEKHIINSEISEISEISRKIIDSVDLDFVMTRRLENYQYLHAYLSKYNRLNLKQKSTFSYPLMVNDGPNLRRYLIDNKIFTPTLWSDQLDEDTDVEYDLIENIIHLPIDQRYSETEMITIVKLINQYYE